MIKNRTQFVLIVGIGLSLFSGLSQTKYTGSNTTKVSEDSTIDPVLSIFRMTAETIQFIQDSRKKEKFYKYKLTFTRCLRKHTNIDTTEMPSACKEPLRKFRMVSTPEQEPAIIQELEEHVNYDPCNAPTCKALHRFKMVATAKEVSEFAVEVMQERKEKEKEKDEF